MSKIGFFLYSNKIAGVENYLVNLINSWPNNKDEIYIFINLNFKHSLKFKKYFTRNIKILYYQDILNSNVYSKKNLINKLTNKINFFLLFFFYKNFFFNNFKKTKIEKFFLVNGGYPGSLYQLILAKKWKLFSKSKPWMIVHNYPKKKKIINFVIDYFIDFLFSKNLAGISTVSNSCLKELNKIFFLKRIKKNFIPNGIEKIKSSNLNNKIKNKLQILMISVFEKRKGFDFIFDVLELLRKENIKFVFYLYGDHSSEDIININRMLKIRNLKKYVLIKKYETDKKKMFKNKHILVLPSRYEPFGLVLLEAMMFKVPVISTNTGGPNEILKNGENGYLVNYGDVQKMCKNIKTLFTNKRRYKSISNRGYDTFIKKYTSKQMSKKFIETLK